MSDRPARSASASTPKEAPLRQVLGATLIYALRWLGVAVVVGVVLAPVAAGFEAVLWWSEARLLRWWLLGLPMVGGLVVGWLIRRARRVGGTGTQEYIGGFERGERLPGWLSPAKWLASVVTLGTGGSGGKAGPMILVGASAGSVLSRWLRADRGEGPDLGALVGAGAALGALFGTPLAGGLMAAEILHAEGIQYRGLFAAVIASWVGAGVRGLLSRPHIQQALVAFEKVEVTAGGSMGGWAWPGWVLAAVVTAAVSLGFILLYGWAEGQFRRRLRRVALRPVVGAAVCWGLGVVGLLVVVSAGGEHPGGVLGTGEGLLSLAVAGGPLVVLVFFLVGKALATAGTVASEGSGGLVFPALIVGGLSGAAVVAAAQGLGVRVPAELPLVGMAGALAAVLNVPVAAAVLLIELFGTRVTVPVLVGTVVGFVVGRPWVVYRYSGLGGPSGVARGPTRGPAPPG